MPKPIEEYLTPCASRVAGLGQGDESRFLLEIRRALRGESAVLSAEMARQMTTVQRSGYGLGLSIQGTGPSANFGHGGSNEGFKCQMTVFVENGGGAVIMTNGDRGGFLAAEVQRAIAREYGWPSSFQPVEKKVVPIDHKALAPLEGRYELRPGKFLDVTLEAGALFVGDDQGKDELFPQDEQSFFDMTEGHDILFVKGPDGRVTHMLIDGRLKAPRR